MLLNKPDLFFSFSEMKNFTEGLARILGSKNAKLEHRSFPDQETYIRVLENVKNKHVGIVCSLNTPNQKIMPLFFLSKTLKELGAKSITLVSPYLAYMRQDKAFNPGESVSVGYFSEFLSSFVDHLVTIDPHLHRIHSLSDIYSIQTTVLHASSAIASWIKDNIENPVIIGPDSESKQWVSSVSKLADAPYLILEKIRYGDRKVKVSIPKVDAYLDHTPVLVDDIISTAKTMIETIHHLKTTNLPTPVCIGVHAIFADNAYQDLKNTGVKRIITCNTIPHPTNKIDLSHQLASIYK